MIWLEFKLSIFHKKKEEKKKKLTTTLSCLKFPKRSEITTPIIIKNVKNNVHQYEANDNPATEPCAAPNPAKAIIQPV